MTRVAIAQCAGAQDPDLPALLEALDRRGIAAVPETWSDPEVAWSSYDATVIRGTWDYPTALQAFIEWAHRVPNLINPGHVVAWNVDKHYLADLRERGVPTIDTTYVAKGETPTFPTCEFVVKPTVGGGSRGAARFEPRAHDAATAHVASLHELGVDAMIQPLIESVETDGETDIIVFDGVVSHSMTKHAPLAAVAPTEASGPAASTLTSASSEQLEVVEATLAAVPHDGPLCFARVDLVATPHGPAVIELEVLEPFLFLSSDAGAADRFAAAIESHSRR